MTNLINYLWEGSICLTLLWVFYKVCLERNTFFAWNRTFLLCSLLVALVFPALNFAGINGINLHNETISIQLTTFEINGSNQFQNSFTAFSISNLIVGVYFIGVILALGQFLLGLVSIMVQTKKAKTTYKGKYLLLEHPTFEPSSFFHFIFLPEGALQSQQNVDWVIAHETTHADYKHSWDRLLLQVVKVVFWFYPIYSKYEKALEVLHEYQVDEKMTKSYPLEEYARLLLNLAKTKNTGLLVHNFNQFQIKKRLTMMTQPKSKWTARSIYALALPVFICLFALVSCEQKDEIIEVAMTANEANTKNLLPNEIFDIVEVMPVPPQGMEGWNNYLSQNLKYPQSARDKKIEGTVYLEFIVNEEGRILNPSVIKSIDPDLDAEALRVIKNSSDWTPGIQRGHNVNVKLKLPIRFKLE